MIKTSSSVFLYSGCMFSTLLSNAGLEQKGNLQGSLDLFASTAGEGERRLCLYVAGGCCALPPNSFASLF